MTPIIEKTIGNTLHQLSTKVRPDIKYKTDRKDLDGGGIDIHNAILKVAPKKVLFYQVIIIQDLAILLKNN